ncbi:MAG: hypothetical protein ABSD92_10460 [Candidatus Bathyarchaeia archaeon]
MTYKNPLTPLKTKPMRIVAVTVNLCVSGIRFFLFLKALKFWEKIVTPTLF